MGRLCGEMQVLPPAMAVFVKMATPGTVSGSAGLAFEWRCVYGDMAF